MRRCYISELICGIYLFTTLTHCLPLPKQPDTDILLENRNNPSTASGSIFAAAPKRNKATTVEQSIDNWTEDVDTVNRFLNTALTIPPGKPLQSAANKALSYAKDEPTNNKYLGSLPNMDKKGKAAAGTLDRVFPDVLVQLQRVVDKPANPAVAIDAVARINVNRCKNVLPAAETLWKSAATVMGMATKNYPPKANREAACVGII